ncbi:hypothetical protein CAEBREN_23736 [Caenorhabditis brenneri]|uniref:Uncharacterized protein n=1 Tax=Caenorhabditis brenneri TaxID=135651 RepID=G0MPM4_CAEBE|nr:hypothetical protein CAEBREN_23736 [Caenorhabditis brenneri]
MTELIAKQCRWGCCNMLRNKKYEDSEGERRGNLVDETISPTLFSYFNHFPESEQLWVIARKISYVGIPYNKQNCINQNKGITTPSLNEIYLAIAHNCSDTGDWLKCENKVRVRTKETSLSVIGKKKKKSKKNKKNGTTTGSFGSTGSFGTTNTTGTATTKKDKKKKKKEKKEKKAKKTKKGKITTQTNTATAY